MRGDELGWRVGQRAFNVRTGAANRVHYVQHRKERRVAEKRAATLPGVWSSPRNDVSRRRRVEVDATQPSGCTGSLALARLPGSNAWRTGLRENAVHDLAVHVGQAEVAAWNW